MTVCAAPIEPERLHEGEEALAQRGARSDGLGDQRVHISIAPHATGTGRPEPARPDAAKPEAPRPETPKPDGANPAPKPPTPAPESAPKS